MKTDALTNPIVRAAIEALQNGNRRPGRRSLSLMLNSMMMGVLVASRSFTHDALGHERFTSVDRVENNGLDLAGAFHSDPMGRFSDILQVSALAWG